tara:strand:- start:2470 stop:3531 length:1062 start_codon:yes stop_codon:yes gene_type:complete
MPWPGRSDQFVPDPIQDRIYLGKKMGGYSGKRIYDPSTPATNTYYNMREGDFSKDMSHSRFSLFLKSPRSFWLRYTQGFVEKYDGPQFTLNNRVGTLAEAHFDLLRNTSPLSPSPLLAGTEFENCLPFIHPNDPDFIETFCGRRTHSWSWARTHGFLFKRKSDPHHMLNVYGEPDELVEFTDKSGQKWIVIIDFKAKSSNPHYGENNEYSPEELNRRGIPKHFGEGFGVSHRIQLEFYAWLLEKIIQRDNLPHKVYPVGHHVIFNVGWDQDDIFNGGSSMNLEMSSYNVSVPLDWSWIESSIELALECILDAKLPDKQGLPSRNGRGQEKFYDFEVFDDRYEWMQNQHPGNWP